MKLKVLKLSMTMKKLSKEISYPVIGKDCWTVSADPCWGSKNLGKGCWTDAIHSGRSAEGHSEDAAEVNIEDDEAHEIYQQMIERAYEEMVQNL